MAFLIVTILLFTGLANYTADALGNALPAVSLRFDTALTRRDIEKISESLSKSAGDVTQIAYWAESQSDAENEHNRQTAEITLLKCHGDSRVILSQTFLSGVYPNVMDTTGCAISSALAASLFGATDVLGLEVKLGGKPYVIRGVFKFDEPLAVLQEYPMADDSAVTFNHIELFLKTGRDGREAALDFARAQRLDPAAIVNGPALSRVAIAMSNFPIYLICLALLCKLFTCTIAPQSIGSRLRHTALLVIALFLMFGANAQFPSYFIPTKWSDFAYWGRLIENYQLRLHELLSLSPTIKDVIFRKCFLKMSGFMLLGIIPATAFICLVIAKKPHPEITVESVFLFHGIFMLGVILSIGAFPINVRLSYVICFAFIVEFLTNAPYKNEP